jgi:hypothetical protein
MASHVIIKINGFSLIFDVTSHKLGHFNCLNCRKAQIALAAAGPIKTSKYTIMPLNYFEVISAYSYPQFTQTLRKILSLINQSVIH